MLTFSARPPGSAIISSPQLPWTKCLTGCGISLITAEHCSGNASISSWPCSFTGACMTPRHGDLSDYTFSVSSIPIVAVSGRSSSSQLSDAHGLGPLLYNTQLVHPRTAPKDSGLFLFSFPSTLRSRLHSQ